MLPDSRKLLADVKQRKAHMELTFERLPELFFAGDAKGESRRRRFSHPLSREGIRSQYHDTRIRTDECMNGDS